MARPCKHENADHLKPGECLVRWDDIGRPEEVLVEQFRCLDCGAWLSLGPANDTDRALAEMYAADLVASRAPNPFGIVTAPPSMAVIDGVEHRGPRHTCGWPAKSLTAGDNDCLRCDAIRLAFEIVEAT